MNGVSIVIRRDDLEFDLSAELLDESEATRYRFLRRVVDEWHRGVNRFSRPGEALLIAEMNNRWVGVCGLNDDPYLSDPRIGRVRKVYVLADCRRSGIARRLVRQSISRSRGHFDRLRLRAEEAGPARLYESLGFRRSSDIVNCTHMMESTPGIRNASANTTT
jgi:GNAT superfamily N-acetyltransferase